MRILICDDDSLFTKQLKCYVEDFFKEKNLALPDICVFDNGENLLKDQGQKDMVFLDVEMPGRSGILVGEQITASSPDTLIFMVTSHAEYLDDAMRFHVFRYLNKPLDIKRLHRNLKDALEEYQSHCYRQIVETKDETIALSSSEIICIESRNRTLIVHSTKGEYFASEPMDYWKQKLSQRCFFQCHRSFIVNLIHVRRFTKDTIELTNEKTAYLTRRKHASFKEAYMLYLEFQR